MTPKPARHLWRLKGFDGRIIEECHKNRERGLSIKNMDHKKQETGLGQPNLDELISMNKAAELSGLTPRHIRLLVSRGILWGEKLGRDWFTTAQVIKEYMASDRHPGPKSQKPEK